MKTPRLGTIRTDKRKVMEDAIRHFWDIYSVREISMMVDRTPNAVLDHATRRMGLLSRSVSVRPGSEELVKQRVERQRKG